MVCSKTPKEFRLLILSLDSGARSGRGGPRKEPANHGFFFRQPVAFQFGGDFFQQVRNLQTLRALDEAVATAFALRSIASAARYHSAQAHHVKELRFRGVAEHVEGVVGSETGRDTDAHWAGRSEERRVGKECRSRW